jgi:hypothetical protein
MLPTDFTTSAVRYKAIPDFPGYHVGDDGSVWSQWKLTILRGSQRHWVIDPTQWKRMRLFRQNQKGYLCVSLRRNGKPTTQQVHTLVLTAFVGPRPEGMECRHFPDRNRENNHLSNLQWGSPQENKLDTIIHGTFPLGERTSGAKLSTREVRVIRQRAAEGEPNWLLAQEFKVHKSTIIAIATRKSWAWLD